MGKSRERQQTTTTQQQPWAGAVPLLQDVARYAPSVFGFGAPPPQQSYGAVPYGSGGGFTAMQQTPPPPGWSGIGLASRLGQLKASGGAMPGGGMGLQPGGGMGMQQQQQQVPGTFGLAGLGADELRNIISGRYVTETNPLLEPIAQRVAGDISGQFAGVGRYGSGVHQEALARGLADVRYKAQEQERARQLAAISGAPGYDLAPLQAYTAGLEARYMPISRYADIANQLAGAGVTATQTTPQYRNPILSGLGGAASGASVGSMFGPIGTGIGAAIGGLGGLFG